jgi:hypothetical protein
MGSCELASGELGSSPTTAPRHLPTDNLLWEWGSDSLQTVWLLTLAFEEILNKIAWLLINLFFTLGIT